MIPPFATSVLADEHSDEERVRDYHERTKHSPHRLAAAPETLDWDAQPSAFRRFEGAPALPLPLELPAEASGGAPLSLASIGALLRLSFGITAWKSQGPDRWAVRANPSSGNLHPVEAYVVVRGAADLDAGVYHYRPEDHALERRALFDRARERRPPALAVGLTTLGWREVWKYGERGFRYVQLDVGHAMAAVAYAAAALGWRVREQAPVDTRGLGRVLGLDRAGDFPAGRWAGVEREEGEVLLSLEIDREAPRVDPAELRTAAAVARWCGRASRIDARPMYEWPVVDDIVRSTRAIGGQSREERHAEQGARTPPVSPGIEVLQRRRSAQVFDRSHEMARTDFFGLLAALRARSTPRELLAVDFPFELLLFVQRVRGMEPGIYAAGLEPDGRELRLLAHAEARSMARLARGLHCNQNIAAQACFALGFIAPFDAPVAEDPANYRRLLRQAGLLGHILYIEAEKRGLRGTGIGCFFDDAVHEAANLMGTERQSLYHFTVGKAMPDPNLEPAPPYPEPRRPASWENHDDRKP
jgi:SagB-type dehydrogenase family enzyme